MVVTLDATRRLTVPAALAPAKLGDYFDAHFALKKTRWCSGGLPGAKAGCHRDRERRSRSRARAS